MSIAQENGTKSWGYVTGDFIDGIGYIGPENAVDNRKHKIVITGSSFNPLVFAKKDVKSVDVVCATSEWIKFRICLKDGKVAVATFTDVSKDPMGVLTFEWWLADVMYKNAAPAKKSAPKKAAPAPAPEAQPVVEAKPAVEPTPVVEEKKEEPKKKAAPKKKAEPKKEEPKKEEPKKEEPKKKAAPKKKAEPKKEEVKEEPKKAPAKKKAAPKKKPAPKKEEVEEEVAVSEEVKKQVEKLEEDPWRLYQFSKQMMGAKSYQVAYYALKKMQKKMDKDPKLAKDPQYKDVPKMLNSIKDEVEYNYKG